MKNFIIASIIVLLPINIYAEEIENPEQNKDFFYKVKLGTVFMKNAVQKGKAFDFFRTSFENMAPSFGIGVGYYLRETVRFDITLDHITNLTMKTKTSKMDLTYKTVFNNIMANVYLKMFETRAAKVFFGLGAGMTNINERIAVNDKVNSEKATYSSKKKSISYMLSITTDIPLTDSITCEASYSWREIGKSKAIKAQNNQTLGTTPYKGHGFGVAVRFDL